MPVRRQSWCLLVWNDSLYVSLLIFRWQQLNRAFLLWCEIWNSLVLETFLTISDTRKLGLPGRRSLSKTWILLRQKQSLQLFYQAYVEHLASVREEALEAAGIKIVVIGCGEWSLIKTYAGMSALRAVHPIKYLMQLTDQPSRKCQIQGSILRWSNSWFVPRFRNGYRDSWTYS